MNIVVLEELKAYIEPLTADEHDALERSLLAEGCRDALVLWGDILVYGHNRYGICTKHGLPFQTVQNPRFQSMEDVHLWMIDQHMGRRSLSDFQRGVLALRKREIVAEWRSRAKAQADQTAGPVPEAPSGDAPWEGEAPAAALAAVLDPKPLQSREDIARAARLKVNSLSESGSWTQIETETGLTGFVATKYLSSTRDEPKSSDKKDSSWVSILVVLGIIGYGLYKIKNLFSGLFGGSSSNSSSHRTPSREPILKWYYCAGCRTTIKQASTPRNSNSCINRDFHKWQERGKVGDKNYECSKCGTTIQTTDTPKIYNSCVNRDFHKLNKF